MTQNADTAPALDTVVWAETDSVHAQRVRVLVTAIDYLGEGGWVVWGYRQYNRPTNSRSRRPRQTAYPRRYFVPTHNASSQ